MSLVESYEYYAACPNCGAANVGLEKCDYCGASLIKKKISTKTSSQPAYEAMQDMVKMTIPRQSAAVTEEEKMYEEDMNLTEIHGKICERDSFLTLFCLIFGGCFLLVPLIVFIAFVSAGIQEVWVWMMLALFAVIGVCSFIPLISNIHGRIKCKNGEEVSGIVRGYEHTNITVNGAPCLAIRILIDQLSNPKILVLKSSMTRRKYPLGKAVKLKKYNNKYIFDDVQ